MTASITSLTARRAIHRGEQILANPLRLKVISAPRGHGLSDDSVPVPAELLEQLLVLARGATEIAETVDAIHGPHEPAS